MLHETLTFKQIIPRVQSYPLGAISPASTSALWIPVHHVFHSKVLLHFRTEGIALTSHISDDLGGK